MAAITHPSPHPPSSLAFPMPSPTPPLLPKTPLAMALPMHSPTPLSYSPGPPLPTLVLPMPSPTPLYSPGPPLPTLGLPMPSPTPLYSPRPFSHSPPLPPPAISTGYIIKGNDKFVFSLCQSVTHTHTHASLPTQILLLSTSLLSYGFSRFCRHRWHANLSSYLWCLVISWNFVHED